MLQQMLKLEQNVGRMSNTSSLIESPTLRYCIIQITSRNGRPATMFSIEKQDPMHAKFYLFRNNGPVTNDLMFRALRESQFLDDTTSQESNNETICSWIIFGDDDTLFFPNNIHQFIRSRQHDPLIHPHTLKAVYGNLAFPYGKPHHSSPSTPTPVWFTGGAGMLLTRASARDALSPAAATDFEKHVVTAFAGTNSSLSAMACGANNECGDGPFCITLQLREVIDCFTNHTAFWILVWIAAILSSPQQQNRQIIVGLAAFSLAMQSRSINAGTNTVRPNLVNKRMQSCTITWKPGTGNTHTNNLTFS